MDEYSPILPLPRRIDATYLDIDRRCFICNKGFFKDQKIDFTIHGKIIHVRRCRNVHRAAILVYYEEYNWIKVVEAFKVSRVAAFRLLKIARELNK